MRGGHLTVLHEDDSLIVVDKPAGLHTAPLHGGEGNTLLACVLASFPEISSVPGMKPFEPGLLHRLDKGTSGVVVIARTAAAFTVLRLQFEAGEAQKEYHAVCECSAGRRLEETVEIQSSFAPAGPGRHKVRVVIPGEKNRKLLRKASRALYITQVKIEQVLGAQALVLAVIRKGFRHQVRAHLAFAGLPIVGDTLYGAPAPDVAEQRMYLHASSILLTHPVTGKLLCVTSPLPESFYAIFRR